MSIILQRTAYPQIHLYELKEDDKLLHRYWVFNHAISGTVLPVLPLYTACKDSKPISQATYYQSKPPEEFLLSHARKEGRTLADKLKIQFIDRTSQSLKTH